MAKELKVMCIDDSYRPNEIPISRWVKKKQEYTVTKIDRINLTGEIGYQLKELPLDKFAPYEYFKASRFVPVIEVEDFEELEKEAELEILM